MKHFTIDYVQMHNVDVIFVTVCPGNSQMGSDGFFLAAILGQTHPDIQIMTYSDSENPAFDAFRHLCAGFLLYPFDMLAMQLFVNRLQYVYELQQTKKQSTNRSIMIRTKNGIS